MSADEEVSTPGSGGSWRDWLARHLQLEPDDRLQVYRSVATSAALRDATYWAEILFSAGIATLGLVMGSPAVIIGAMLISPLMGPIMSAGLALAAGDFILASRALLSIGLSSILAVAFSTSLVVLLPFREMTAEIAARTQPNTLDLIIALFSGAVGALAVCKSLRGVATSIPGVAIAVALMPPLCVTGYGLGLIITLDRVQGFAVLRGGGLLYLTNLVAITFSSMLVFLMLHIDSDAVRERIREWRLEDRESAEFQRLIARFIPQRVGRIGSLPARIALLIALLALLVVPLTRSFDALAAEIRQRQELNRNQKLVSDMWNRTFGETLAGQPRSFVDSMNIEEDEGQLRITVRAFVSQSVTPDERRGFVDQLARKLGRNSSTIDLALIEIPTSQYHVARVQAEPEAAPPRAVESLGRRFERAAREAVLRLNQTALPERASIIDATLTIGSAAPRATIMYLAPTPISDDARALIEASLRDRLQLSPLELRLMHIPSQLVIDFPGRSVAPNDDTATQIDALAAALRERGELLLRVSGGASPRGRARADAVRSRLVQRGIGEERIQTQQGETDDSEVTIEVTRRNTAAGAVQP